MTKAMKFLSGDCLYFRKNRKVAYVILMNGPTQHLIRLNCLSLILVFNRVVSYLK